MHDIGADDRQSDADKQGGRTIGRRAGFGHRNLRHVPAEKGGHFVKNNIAIPSALAASIPIADAAKACAGRSTHPLDRP